MSKDRISQMLINLPNNSLQYVHFPCKIVFWAIYYAWWFSKRFFFFFFTDTSVFLFIFLLFFLPIALLPSTFSCKIVFLCHRLCMLSISKRFLFNQFISFFLIIFSQKTGISNVVSHKIIVTEQDKLPMHELAMIKCNWYLVHENN